MTRPVILRVDPAAILSDLPLPVLEMLRLPADGDGPVFGAPWEAQAFALAVALHAGGAFEWKEWADSLGEVIAEVKARGEPDTGENYYRHWLTALERIVARKGIVAVELLERRRAQWDEAARRTPHGRPIEI